MNIADQSNVFLCRLAFRKRRPVKPATLDTYSYRLAKWINPRIGNMDVATFNNGSMKEFADDLAHRGLGAKTIVEIVSLVKQVLASTVDENGEVLYPKTWNNEFIDLPVIDRQKGEAATLDQVNAAVRHPKYGILFAFLAGTGLRIGEALAVRYGCFGQYTCWDPNSAVVRVRTSLWHGMEQLPKTPSAVRDVDLDPRLNTLLCGQQPNSFNNGRMFDYPLRSVQRMARAYGIRGCHSFRRFRATQLRQFVVPEDIIRYWLGHATQNITDRYSKLAGNQALRKEWAQKVGLGFDIPSIKDTINT